MRLRLAREDDADQIAVLHTDSWRRHYRGAYADSFLDGDVEADRRSVWSTRLAAPANSETVLAEHGGRLVGFVHVVFDDDPRATGNAMYLWVLQQNTAAQEFYYACGARCVETATVSPPGGHPARLNDSPRKLRLAWPDVRLVVDHEAA